jgi:hypothetical protein
MGYERHLIPPAKTQSSPKTVGVKAPQMAAPPRVAPPDDADIRREARRMRDEWRRERYSRLRPN